MTTPCSGDGVCSPNQMTIRGLPTARSPVDGMLRGNADFGIVGTGWVAVLAGPSEAITDRVYHGQPLTVLLRIKSVF